jgi:hypothetical protein
MYNFVYKDYKFTCDIGTMTPCQYIRMINLLEETNSKRICELGSGISTEIFDVYCSKSNAIRYSIEHDEHYNRYDNTIMLSLKEYDKCTRYDGFEEWLNSQDKFDFVLIDAPNDGIPFYNPNLEYARVQLLDFVLMNKLNDNSIVMYHDSERNLAKNTLNEFEKLVTEHNFLFSKEIVIEKDKEVSDYNKLTLGVCPELTIYKLWK